MNVLAGLRNGQNTDLLGGTVRNADAVLLLLASRGGVATTKELRTSLQQWRPGLRFTYLFASRGAFGGYGFCGPDFVTPSCQVYHYGQYKGFEPGGHESTRRHYYYRLRRGTIAISAEGFKRLEELGRPFPTA